MKKIKTSLIFIYLIFTNNCFSQYFFEGSDTNFYQIQGEFYTSPGMREDSANESSFFYKFKRYEDFLNNRVYPTGSFKLLEANLKDYYSNWTSMQNAPFIHAANWQPLGPTGFPNGTSGYKGNGFVNSIAFDPGFDDVNNKTIYLGSVFGGLWKTTDGGVSWSNASVNLDYAIPFIGVQNIAIDPNNGSNLFVSISYSDTHNGFVSPFSFGVYRSTNGGASWLPINVGLNPFSYESIPKLLVDPTNSNTIYAASAGGIYKTTNALGGSPSWTKVLNTPSFYQVVFKPGSTTTLFASGKDIVQSNNSGGTWASITGSGTGLDLTTDFPNQSVQRINIGVSPASVNLIYAHIITMYTVTVGNFTKGTRVSYMYRYNGTNWIQSSTQVFCTDPSRMSMAVDPISPNVLYVTSEDVRKNSTAGSGAFTTIGFANGNVHADIHDLKISPGSMKLYAATDGGLFVCPDPINAPLVWLEINTGLQVGTIWDIGVSAIDANKILIGEQDCGSNYFDGTNWNFIRAGDGMGQAFDAKTVTTSYAAIDQANTGDVAITTNGWATGGFALGKPCGVFDAVWPYPIKLHEESNKLYIGYNDLNRLHSVQATGCNRWVRKAFLQYTSTYCRPIQAFEIAPSDTNYIYISSQSTQNPITCKPPPFLLMSADGGTTPYTYMSPPDILPISGIAADPKDPKRIWITYQAFGKVGGFANKVKYFDGTNWFDYSSGLPDMPVNCIVYEKGSNDGLYIGTDVGVFYRNASMSSWDPFMTNLPNVIVRDLEINYSENKIRAGTYGRGLWESSLACPLSTNISLNNVNGITGFQEAYNNITASNSIVDPLSKVTFRAGNFIELTPGAQKFEAVPQSGNYFNCFIHRCDAPGNSPSFRLGRNSNMPQESTKLPESLSLDEEKDLMVYPNPNSGKFNIVCPIGIREVVIYNILGQVAFSGGFSTEQNSLEVDLTDKPKGVYFIRIEDANGKTKSKKILYQ